MMQLGLRWLVERVLYQIVNMPIPVIREDVKIDQNHIELIYGLIISAKPSSILEFGLGTGRTTDRILSAIDYNGIPVRYSVVDNWAGFGGKIPEEAIRVYGSRASLVSQDEGEFIRTTQEHYDFIVCDADHLNSEKYFDETYSRLLNPDGILIYHDVVGAEFPNLHTIRHKASNLSHVVFSQSTRPDEHCERGLIVIFKNK
jgi:predicted O-methyltransferase YrrM